MFSVVKFPNSECTGQNGYNGTCYTKDECTVKGGSESGSCASGFGICCTFSMTCGSKSTENNTYFEQTTFTTYSGGNIPCVYTICPLANVCRIKLELNTFDITGPIAKSDAAADKAAIGKCQLESMSISSPGMKPPPIICGINSGQHMFLDVSGSDCIDVNININTLDTTTSRTWSPPLEMRRQPSSRSKYKSSEANYLALRRNNNYKARQYRSSTSPGMSTLASIVFFTEKLTV